MIGVVENATRDGIGQSRRTNLDTKFQELSTQFKQILSTAAGRSYDGIKKTDLITVFQNLGFDESSSKTFVDLLNEFDYKSNTDNLDVLATDSSQAKRPIKVPQSAYATTIRTVYNNGNGTFYQTATRTTNTASENYRDVKTGDFNGDTFADLAFLGSNGNITVTLGNGDGSFKAPSTYSFGVASADAKNISVTDLNGDGKSDITLLSPNSGNISTMLANSDGSFAAAITEAIIGSGSAIDSSFVSSTITKVDGDSNPDLVSVIDSGIMVNLGNGDGTFKAAATTIPIGGVAPTSFTTLDYNNDGKTDIAITSSSGLKIYQGDGTGNFSLAQSLTDATTTSSNLTSKDVNGDGYADLIAADSATGKVRVWLNSSGTYSASTTLASVGSVTSVQTGDINNDGFADIVAISGANNKVLTYFGNGNGTFNAAITSTISSNAQAGLLKDFNNDGLSELVTGDNTVSGIDNMTFSESTPTVVDSTGRRGSTQDYGSLFAAGRNIKSRPDAYKMLADLKALDKQLDTNIASMKDAFTFVVDNMQMLRGVGLAFIDATKELIQRKPNSADQIAAIVEEKVRNGGSKVAAQIGNLTNLSALAVSRLGNASTGQ